MFTKIIAKYGYHNNQTLKHIPLYSVLPLYYPLSNSFQFSGDDGVRSARVIDDILPNV